MSWRFFSYEGDSMLACPESGERGMNDAFMRKMDRLRMALGVPIRVTSGFRSPEYNEKISTTGIDGPHTTGRAIDIQLMGDISMNWELLQYARGFGFYGVGFRMHGPHEKRFIHLDDLEAHEAPRPRIWTYDAEPKPAPRRKRKTDQ